MKTARSETMAMMRISRSTWIGFSPALRAADDELNLGAHSDSRRLSRFNCSQ